MMFLYSAKNNSFLDKMDPRVKIISFIGFIAIMSSVEKSGSLIFGTIFLIVLGFLAGISPTFFARRLLWILPFGGTLFLLLPFIVPGAPLTTIVVGPVNLGISVEGLSRAVILFLRMTIGLFSISLLTATTPLGKLLLGFRQLYVPHIIIVIIEFTIRYIFVTINELKRMTLAAKARRFKPGRNLFHLRTFQVLGTQIGVLFLRSNDRGERIYRAMLSRGYSSNTPIKKELKIKPLDISFGLTVMVVALLLNLVEAEIWKWLL